MSERVTADEVRKCYDRMGEEALRHQLNNWRDRALAAEAMLKRVTNARRRFSVPTGGPRRKKLEKEARKHHGGYYAGYSDAMADAREIHDELSKPRRLGKY